MAFSGMEIGLLVGLLVFIGVLAISTWQLSSNISLGIFLMILAILGIIGFGLALVFVAA
jgi:hypothetical protein